MAPYRAPRKSVAYGHGALTARLRAGSRLVRGLRQLARTDVEVRRALRHGVGQTVVVDGGHAAGHGRERRGGVGAVIDHLGRAGHQVVHAGADGFERLGQTVGEADLDAFHEWFADHSHGRFGRRIDLCCSLHRAERRRNDAPRRAV